jgi:ribosomal-protein-alanine N-acetyltransferase
MEISLMCLKDMDYLVELENKIFHESLGKGYFELQFKNPRAYYLVLKDEGKIIGYLGSTVEEMSEIQNFCIDESYQGKGYGKMLLEAALEEMISYGSKSVYLEVNEINQKAINLYKKYGFEIDHIRKGYYKGKDAYVMIKKLGD